MPLVMLEAMATGLIPVVPPVGSIPDVVTDGDNGFVVSDRQPRTFARVLGECLDETANRQQIAANATSVRSQCSAAQASIDWRHILATLDG
jgi:glycosyltransferase involved in cell wall biosynthesis